ncbi:FadR/GntR family transcriptional regulator [Paenibacillus silvisoli]|uniref:FadR/GntR family transcriptional regulator n=1 Tax=Paenibacillus silvisoli TaxID=3110539 RepID=UPI002804B0AA|nr:FadR/GntR family transcriptional regulator [Paenibacillus silvisoli]
MEVTRISKRNHYEEIAEQLKRLVIDGKLKVGDKLPSTKEMSEQFGVGRSTMREALSALKAMGYIEIKQGGGCTVISSSPVEVELPELQSLRMNRETLLELLEARQSLEVSNASIAAVKASDDDLAALHGIMLEMEAAVGDDHEGERTDVLFHATLAQATHNSILVRMFDSIVSQLEMAIREIRRVEIYANRSVSERLYREHLAIYEAISSRNADLAGERMKRHLEHVVSNLMKHL